MSLRGNAVAALLASAVVLALSGCGSSTSSTAPAGLDNSAPAAPTNLVGLFDGTAGTDYLIWTGSSSANVASYEVWQYSDNPLSGNAGQLVGTASSAVAYFALPAPEQNLVYYYRMRSSNALGSLGAFSAPITVQRHGAPGQVDPTPEPVGGDGGGLPTKH